VQQLMLRAEQLADQFDAQSIANTLWALSTMAEVLPVGLVASLSKQAERVLADFSPLNIANTLWALATTGLKPKAGLVSCLSKQVEACESEFTPQLISNTLWAIAHAQVVPSFRRSVCAWLKDAHKKEWRPEQMSQMHQFFLVVQHEKEEKNWNKV
jgi:hypothetical protein